MKKKIFIMVILAFILMLFISSCAAPVCDVPKTVLIDNTHCNIKGLNLLSYYLKFISTIQSMGYIVSYTSISGFIPEEYGIFIIAAPVYEYSIYELQKVTTFLSKCNRKLILIGEWYSFYDNKKLNTILSYLGSDISFYNIKIYDNTNNFNNSSIYPMANTFINHPVTTNLNSIVLFGGTAINVSGDAIALAKTSDDSYFFTPEFVSNTFSRSTDSHYKELDNAIYGPFNVLAVQSLMNGKILAIGDSSIFSNAIYNSIFAIDIADNKDLLKNIINW